MTTRTVLAIATAWTLACAGDPGTEPAAMSAEGHERAAGAEEAAAREHEAQFDPQATQPGPLTCTGTYPIDAGGVCWSSLVNPTDRHQSEMQKHRELAERHRAAAKTLRDAETTACGGIADRDRDTSPFYRREDIASVSEVEGGLPRGQPRAMQLAGAKAVFRAVPGMTAEWLQRLVDCHSARAASVGFDMPEMDYCPLAVKGSRGAVSSTGSGFAITVTAEEPDAVKEIKRRIMALQMPVP